MLLSLALIMVLGLFFGEFCKKMRLPALCGMILAGILLGPWGLDAICSEALGISSALRRIALIIILIRAGLSLNLRDLKRLGRAGLLMCFLPACFEIVGMTLIAPRIFDFSYLEGALMGTVVAAVSPAVVVPRMIKLIDEGIGSEKGVPQLVLAGASVDDVFVIVAFSAVSGLMQGKAASILGFVNVPVSIILGIVCGVFVGACVYFFGRKLKLDDNLKAVFLLGMGLLLDGLEGLIKTPITFSALVAVMFMGIFINEKDKNSSKNLAKRFNGLWAGAEIFLFVFVGCCVNLDYVFNEGVGAVFVVLLALAFRGIGVLVCLLGTELNLKERIFCMGAYMPKATVQAAMGAIPLSMGFACGEAVLTVAVIAILITAPLGGLFIDVSCKKLLKEN